MDPLKTDTSDAAPYLWCLAKDSLEYNSIILGKDRPTSVITKDTVREIGSVPVITLKHTNGGIAWL